MTMMVDDPAEQASRVEAAAQVAGIPCADANVLADQLRAATGITNISVIPDAALAERLRALHVATMTATQTTVRHPSLNADIEDVDIRNALGKLDLSTVPADRRMGVLAKVTRMVDEKRKANASPPSVDNHDPGALAGLHGEEKLRVWRAGKAAFVQHQNLTASLPRLSSGPMKATAQATLNHLAEVARRGGYKVP